MYFLSPSLVAFLHYNTQRISGGQICAQREVKHKDFLLFMVLEGKLTYFFKKLICARATLLSHVLHALKHFTLRLHLCSCGLKAQFSRIRCQTIIGCECRVVFRELLNCKKQECPQWKRAKCGNLEEVGALLGLVYLKAVKMKINLSLSCDFFHKDSERVVTN